MWQSRKQPTVARSSTEAEYRSLADAASEVIWLKKVLAELGVKTSDQATLWCDSMSAGYLSANPVLHSTTKHVAVNYHFVREKVADKSLVVRHISTKSRELIC